MANYENNFGSHVWKVEELHVLMMSNLPQSDVRKMQKSAVSVILVERHPA